MLNVRTNGVKTKNQLAPTTARPDNKKTNTNTMNTGKNKLEQILLRAQLS